MLKYSRRGDDAEEIPAIPGRQVRFGYIFYWSYENLGRRTAESMRARLYHAFELVAQFRDMGVERPDLTDEPVRVYPVGLFLIFYQHRHQPVRIVAVLHGSRNVRDLL